MNRIRTRIDQTVKDPKVAKALKPWHRRWCKRPLFHDEYYPTFNRTNVELVDTAGKGVERLTENAVVVDGKEYPVDCLIFATGFEVGTAYVNRAGYDIVGREGKKLSDYWADGMKTFFGLHIRGFPNCLYIGYGQNATATNFVYILDQQAQHIAYTLKEARNRGARTVEPTEQAVAEYVAEVNPMSFSQQKFWQECTPSYFNDEGKSDSPHGFFANMHPAGTVGFYSMLREWRESAALKGLEFDGNPA